MSDVATGFEARALARQFEDIDREIASYAALCKVNILQEATIQRIIDDDASVCGTNNPIAFNKMRDLLMMHYVMRERAFEEHGAAETQAIIDTVVGRIRERFEKLGIGLA